MSDAKQPKRSMGPADFDKLMKPRPAPCEKCQINDAAEGGRYCWYCCEGPLCIVRGCTAPKKSPQDCTCVTHGQVYDKWRGAKSSWDRPFGMWLSEQGRTK